VGHTKDLNHGKALVLIFLKKINKAKFALNQDQKKKLGVVQE